MKRLITASSLVLLFSSLALAQNFSGTYVLESGEGDTVLTVQQDSQGKVRGTLQLDDGSTFQLAGEIKNNEAIGIASNQGTSKLFKLRFQGKQLIYTIIPVTADNKPDVQNAQEFPFVRHGDAPATPGGGFQGPGNPLGTAAPVAPTADPAVELTPPSRPPPPVGAGPPPETGIGATTGSDSIMRSPALGFSPGTDSADFTTAFN